MTSNHTYFRFYSRQDSLIKQEKNYLSRINTLSYLMLYYLLVIINFGIIGFSFFLSFNDQWIQFYNRDFLGIIDAVSLSILISCILIPCKRKDNIDVQKSFIIILVGTIFMQILGLIVVSELEINMLKIRGKGLSKNNTNFIKNTVEKIYLSGKCSTTKNEIICENNAKWFSKFINKQCPLINNTNLYNTTPSCLQDFNIDKLSIVKKRSIDIYCNCRENIFEHILQILSPFVIISGISLVIDIYLMMNTLYIYYRLRSYTKDFNEV